MGLFSFFSKKPDAGPATVHPAARAGEPTRPQAAHDAERARQRDIARATAAKIDAIELEMTSDIFNEPEPVWTPPAGKRVIQPAGAAAAVAAVTTAAPAAATAATATAVTSEAPDDAHGPASLFDLPQAAAAPASAPVEESAILYAQGEDAATEALLTDSLATQERKEHRLWWMLFDLYQAQGREDDFNDIAIDYASTFETSPPPYQQRSSGVAASASGVAPTAVLAGTLDAADAAPLARLLAAPPDSLALRIELDQVRAVTEPGCARLLAALQALRKQARPLVVAGADQLAALLRPALVVGDTSAGAAPWLLRIELLQILHREKEFEEAAMDYCVTFEVSPPSFEPAAHVASAAPARNGAASGDHFMLPAIIDGDCAPLMADIGAFVAANNPAVLDCAKLARIDYGCAAVLVEKLRALRQGPAPAQASPSAPRQAPVQIELRDLNHLVAELLRLLGGAECARLHPHKY